jgi:hypothetical protein
MVSTAGDVGPTGVVSAWEVGEMGLRGIQEAGMLRLENMEMGALIDV